MKVLLISDYSTPGGGAEHQNLTLKKYLSARGHAVRMFSSSATSADADYLCLGTTSSFRTLLQSANPWAHLALKRTLEEFQPDVIHVMLFLTQLSPLILPLLRDIPTLYYAVWHRPVCLTGCKLLPDLSVCDVKFGLPCLQNGCVPLHDWLPLMAQMKMWWQWRSVFRVVVAASADLGGQLSDHGFAPVRVVWPGVPTNPARPPLSGTPTAAFTGRLVQQKGVHVLLNAFKTVVQEMPEARLIIAGDGEDGQKLKQLSNSRGIDQNVQWLGALTREDVELALQSAWVQVVPSLGREAFGMVAAEAMMRGTSVIASNSGGLSELVGSRGACLPPNDAARLSEAILEAFRNPERTQKLGEEARRFALAELTEEVYVSKIEAILTELASSSSPGFADRRFTSVNSL